MELERILGKLRYDGSVTGFALITNDGQPFLSFSLPEGVFPQIRGAMKIHSSSLKLVNVMTNEGIVVLSRVDPNWVLAVCFSGESLGSALQKTKVVVDMLEQVRLPPPPSNIEVQSVTEQSPEALGGATAETAAPTVEQGERPAPTKPQPSETVIVRHACVVHRGARYSEALTLGSNTNKELRGKFANVGVDVLLLIDEKKTVFKLSELLTKTVEQVINIVTWCVSERIVTVDCPEEQESGTRTIVEFPLFMGDIKKVKKEHQPVLILCDGTRTLQDIALKLNMPYFAALQTVIPYRGKTLRFVGKDRIAE